MNKYRLAGVAAAAVTTPLSAYALNFDFTFTGSRGGIVSGEVFGLAASGPSKATDIYIDSVPTGFDTPAVPYDLFAKLVPGTNSFSVSQGSVIAYKFTGNTTNNGIIGLALEPAKVAYATAANGTGDLGAGQRGGFVTFTPAAAVPEPASIGLLGAGLAGISAFRRRRRAIA